MSKFAYSLAGIIFIYYGLKKANEYGYLKLNSEDQTGNFVDQIPSIEDAFYMTQEEMNQEQKNKNVYAFLQALRYAEGTTSPEGYRALFGWRPGNGKVFSSFADHPRQFFSYTNLAGKTIRTSAAGAYQITATTYDALRRNYQGRFAGFSESVQDEMALTLIAEKNALSDVENGRFELAIKKVKGIWASLPNSNVDQPTRQYNQVAQAYLNAGGFIA